MNKLQLFQLLQQGALKPPVTNPAAPLNPFPAFFGQGVSPGGLEESARIEAMRQVFHTLPTSGETPPRSTTPNNSPKGREGGVKMDSNPRPAEAMEEETGTAMVPYMADYARASRSREQRNDGPGAAMIPMRPGGWNNR
ncbi:MAG: hypothetical protein HQL56_12090 [Magnetococcales bacterium]|nr:hypothetical protein [Magnetococcales bacterium]